MESLEYIVQVASKGERGISMMSSEKIFEMEEKLKSEGYNILKYSVDIESTEMISNLIYDGRISHNEVIFQAELGVKDKIIISEKAAKIFSNVSNADVKKIEGFIVKELKGQTGEFFRDIIIDNKKMLEATNSPLKFIGEKIKKHRLLQEKNNYNNENSSYKI